MKYIHNLCKGRHVHTVCLQKAMSQFAPNLAEEAGAGKMSGCRLSFWSASNFHCWTCLWKSCCFLTFNIDSSCSVAETSLAAGEVVGYGSFKSAPRIVDQVLLWQTGSQREYIAVYYWFCWKNWRWFSIMLKVWWLNSVLLCYFGCGGESLLV